VDHEIRGGQEQGSKYTQSLLLGHYINSLIGGHQEFQ